MQRDPATLLDIEKAGRDKMKNPFDGLFSLWYHPA
jgi:hypothetical protein